MSKNKGWINYDKFQSRRHGLSALGISTGRKLIPKKSALSVIGGNQKMFYPKQNNLLKTVLVAPIKTPVKAGKTVGKLTKLNYKAGDVIEVFGHKYIYNPETEKMARTFFIKRFRKDPSNPVEKRYFEEWRHRFYTGSPTGYMDSLSKKVYTRMLDGDLTLPKDWKGKGGSSVKIVDVTSKANMLKEITRLEKQKKEVKERGKAGKLSLNEVSDMSDSIDEDIKRMKGRLDYPKTTLKVTRKNLVDNIMAYEQGQLSEKQTVNLFSYLVKSGQAWTLQGHYGRSATGLIKAGYIDKKGTILKKGVELNYTKNNKTKKIVAGALVGATVGALTYCKGGKKMKKKMNYNGDVTYEDTTTGIPSSDVEGMTIEPDVPKKEGFLKKVGRGAVAFGKGAKTTYIKGRELLDKAEEARVRRQERELAKAQADLKVIRAKKQIKATKASIEKESPSIFPKLFGNDDDKSGKKGKSLIPKIF